MDRGQVTCHDEENNQKQRGRRLDESEVFARRGKRQDESEGHDAKGGEDQGPAGAALEKGRACTPDHVNDARLRQERFQEPAGVKNIL